LNTSQIEQEQGRLIQTYQRIITSQGFALPQAGNTILESLFRSVSARTNWAKHDINARVQLCKVLFQSAGSQGPNSSSYASHAKMNMPYPAVASHTAQPQAIELNSLTQSSSLQSYFFPSQQAFYALISTLKSAKRSLDICVFTITDDDVANTIIAAHKGGVKVRIISDDEQAKTLGSDIEKLRDQHRIPVKTDANVKAHMHHKFAIIDGTTLINGSYNWTKNARFNNQENFMIIKDANCVKSYQAEFEKLWRTF
jgi:phosphatidylserine/phosphatidylglycerophosphate/cardiolipin synthase-like enzyme